MVVSSIKLFFNSGFNAIIITVRNNSHALYKKIFVRGYINKKNGLWVSKIKVHT